MSTLSSWAILSRTFLFAFKIRIAVFLVDRIRYLAIMNFS